MLSSNHCATSEFIVENAQKKPWTCTYAHISLSVKQNTKLCMLPDAWSHRNMVEDACRATVAYNAEIHE